MNQEIRYVNGVEVQIHHHDCAQCGTKFECNSYNCCRGEITTGAKECDECYNRTEREIAQAEARQASLIRRAQERLYEPDY